MCARCRRGHDEYITIEGNHVVWSSGARIIKSFELEPSITPNADIPMTLRSATTMNVDTPTIDNQYSLNLLSRSLQHKAAGTSPSPHKTRSIYDRLPFANDTMLDHSSHRNQSIQCNAA